MLKPLSHPSRLSYIRIMGSVSNSVVNNSSCPFVVHKVQLWQKIKQEEEQYGFHVSPLEATAGHVLLNNQNRTAKEKHTSSEVHHRADSGSVPAFHLLFLDTPQWLLLSGERLQVYIIGRDGTYKGVSAIYKDRKFVLLWNQRRDVFLSLQAPNHSMPLKLDYHEFIC
ncbi:hypothetical protein Tco_0017376 [Tanacetum coccineum]